MWHKRKHSLFGFNRLNNQDLSVLSVVKVLAVSALVYQTAKYVAHEWMDN